MDGQLPISSNLSVIPSSFDKSQENFGIAGGSVQGRITNDDSKGDRIRDDQ